MGITGRVKIGVFPDGMMSVHAKFPHIVKPFSDIVPVKDSDIVFSVLCKSTEIYGDYNYDMPIINGELTDTLKSNVEKHFVEVFGYTSFVNPEIEAKYVKKCEKNGRHDGVIKTSSERKEDGYVYQKLINTFDGNHYRDYRVYVFDRAMKYACIKRKDDIFKSNTYALKLENPDYFFTEKEIKLINLFCESMKIDYAEVDILRDSDGLIYIIDVNALPSMGNAAYTLYMSTTADFYGKLTNEMYNLIQKML